jgi:hypothetical protein
MRFQSLVLLAAASSISALPTNNAARSLQSAIEARSASAFILNALSGAVAEANSIMKRDPHHSAGNSATPNQPAAPATPKPATQGGKSSNNAKPAATANIAQMWQQCGGNGFTGSTTCASGSTCKVQNAWYSQCLPDSAQALYAREEIEDVHKRSIVPTHHRPAMYGPHDTTVVS